jgi:hypothetical protein
VAGEISRSTTIRTEESKKTHQVNGGEVEMWRDEPTPHWPEQLHEKRGKVWMLGKGEGRRRLRNPRERAESLKMRFLERVFKSVSTLGFNNNVLNFILIYLNCLNSRLVDLLKTSSYHLLQPMNFFF